MVAIVEGDSGSPPPGRSDYPLPAAYCLLPAQVMAKNPWMWKYSWHLSAMPGNRQILDFFTKAFCGSAFRQCIKDVRAAL